jgi:hypothetical protein
MVSGFALLLDAALMAHYRDQQRTIAAAVAAGGVAANPHQTTHRRVVTPFGI